MTDGLIPLMAIGFVSFIIGFSVYAIRRSRRRGYGGDVIVAHQPQPVLPITEPVFVHPQACPQPTPQTYQPQPQIYQQPTPQMYQPQPQIYQEPLPHMYQPSPCQEPPGYQPHPADVYQSQQQPAYNPGNMGPS